ncbi:MAG: hypothetical protein D8M57_03070 [Candidatus Scalindua sp. AMX11]|nr:MAG: hypothetical protein D8M57_03070 [Candidatus Scalindua sp. AMX11]
MVTDFGCRSWVNPLVDDSNGDLDENGITNKREHDEGSNPALDTKWVEISSTNTEKGTFDDPYITVGEGVNSVKAGGEIIIKTGKTDETPVIEKEVIIDASGGEAVIGEMRRQEILDLRITIWEFINRIY